jgi:hypothetical protein
MKTIYNNDMMIQYPEYELNQFVEPVPSDDFKIVGFEKKKNLLTITIFSLLFPENEIKVKQHDNKIIIIATETVELNKKSPEVFVDWQMYIQKSYLKMRSFHVLLPGDNFYLIRHYLIPEQFELKILLQQPFESLLH